MELLPEVQKLQVKSGKLPGIAVNSGEEVGVPAKSDLAEVQEARLTSLLIPSSTDSSLVLGTDHTIPLLRPSNFETPTRLRGSVHNQRSELVNYGSPSIFLTNSERGLKPLNSISKGFKLVDTVTPGTRRVSPISASPLREIKEATHRNLQDTLPEMEENGFINQLQNTTRHDSYRVTTNQVSTPSSKHGLFKDYVEDLNTNVSGKRSQSDRDGRHWNMVSSDDPMDISLR